MATNLLNSCGAEFTEQHTRSQSTAFDFAQATTRSLSEVEGVGGLKRLCGVITMIGENGRLGYIAEIGSTEY